MEKYTMHGDRGKNDAMDGRHSGENQGRCQASVPQPFEISSKYASCNEDIVSRGERR